jgi:uncharacterized peroxidase-related enzyme
MAATAQKEFTIEPVEWQAWLETVDPEDATPDQIAVLDESTSSARTSPYYLLLAHDVDVLRQRSRLFNSVMYGQGGLPREDRELGAVATSRVNGCVFCASVHARLFAQLRGETETIESLLREGANTELGERDRAVVDYAVKLTRDPSAIGRADLEPLRRLGLTDLEILDLTHAVAMFAWANRLMQTLGEPVRPS